MSRRRRAVKRVVQPDGRYQNQVVTLMIRRVMERGKRSVAQGVVYDALDEASRMAKKEPLEVFLQALENVRPRLEVKSRRVGGATYQVPIEVSAQRQVALAMRWLIQYAKSRKGQPMSRALAAELTDAYNNQGNAIKKRDDTHKMAQANRAFAHYRW